MEEYLDRAEILLRNVLQSRDISTLVVLHHLRDLAEVLDNLELYYECNLTGNCALDLAEALVRRSLEFRQERAETLALIAGLTVYQPRAHTLFTQAVSICEEVVANDASYSNKNRLFLVLGRAGYRAPDDLRAQWMGRAVELMTKELPPTTVHPEHRCIIYYNYGHGLNALKQYSNALEAFHQAISIRRTLINNNSAKSDFYLAKILIIMGITLRNLGKYSDAIVAYKEALDISTAMSGQDPLQYNEMMATTLHNYGITLGRSNQFSEAAVVEKQAISFYRNLAQTGKECTKSLCDALHNCGWCHYSLGQHAEAAYMYQEAILLRRALAATDSEEERRLIVTLHSIAHCFLALDKHADANAAANESLERNQGRVVESCLYAPDFQACFVCQRATIPDSTQNISLPLPFVRAAFSASRVEHLGSDTPLPQPRSQSPLERW